MLAAVALVGRARGVRKDRLRRRVNGGAGPDSVAPIRLPANARWSLAEGMAAEREAFGFYFSAHPVDAQRHLLAAHKVKSFAELADVPISAEGRATATMAGLVEDVRWRTSAKGRRYMMATISDASGQYVATAFDSEPSSDLEVAAKQGACGLLSVELDRRPGEDVPRVTVKRFQPLEGLAKRTRLQLHVHVADPALIAQLAAELADHRGSNGIVRATLNVSDGRTATFLLGQDFALDADVAMRLERLLGEGQVELSAPPKLALVG